MPGKSEDKVAAPAPGLGNGADSGATCRDGKQGAGKMVSSPSDLLGLRLASRSSQLAGPPWMGGSVERSGMEVELWELSLLGTIEAVGVDEVIENSVTQPPT